VLAQATAQTEAGDFDAAAALVHAELVRLFELPGARDSWSATEALPLLGDLAYRQADFETLLELSTRSLALRTRFLPSGHSLYRSALNNRALALGAWGRAREALEAFELLLQLCETSLGPDDDASINARMRIGMALAEAGETGRAVEWQRDLVTRLAPHGDDSRLNGARARLAEYCMQSGDLHTARALFEVALSTVEAAGTDTRMIISLRGDLGWLLWLQGDALAARAVQEPALKLATETMGNQDMELQRQRALLALTLSALGEHEAALELEELAYTSMSARLPPEHPDLVRVRANLAMTRLETGEVEGALDLLEEGVALLEGSKSGDDETVLSARRGLAHGLVELGRFEEARLILREVAEARARVLPPDHPVLESSRWSCLAVAMRMREREESEQLARVIAAARLDMLIAATRIHAPREVAELAARNGELTDVLLSLGAGCGSLEPVHALDAAVFAMVEAARGAELASARILRSAAHDDALRGLREAARVASHEVARMAQAGDGPAFSLRS
jgi:tetratricopeptide (TPR) repeat protein